MTCRGSGADLGFYKGGCPFHLKGAPEVERRSRRWGLGSGEGVCPSPENFSVSYIENGEFMHSR